MLPAFSVYSPNAKIRAFLRTNGEMHVKNQISEAFIWWKNKTGDAGRGKLLVCIARWHIVVPNQKKFTSSPTMSLTKALASELAPIRKYCGVSHSVPSISFTME